MSRHAVFNYFLSYTIEQDATTTSKHRKRIIELFKNIIVLFDGISTIWENTDDCADQYHCATALYLL